MRNIKYIILWFLLTNHAKIFAGDPWILGWASSNKETAFEKIRTGNFSIADLPNILKFAIDFLMGFAWSVAIIFVIIWWYKLAFGSLQNDKSKWKETIIMAISWFVLAALSWVILKIIIDNLT